jgi:hypothetical protein
LDLLTIAREETPAENFRIAYQQSTRVSRFKAVNPRAYALPDNYIYYNPEKERNGIIRESHLHDYEHIEKIELEAKAGSSLKHIHMSDMVQTAEVQEMDYSIGNEEFELRKEIKRKFTFQIDMEAELLPQEDFLTVIKTLRQSGAVT